MDWIMKDWDVVLTIVINSIILIEFIKIIIGYEKALRNIENYRERPSA